MAVSKKVAVQAAAKETKAVETKTVDTKAETKKTEVKPAETKAAPVKADEKKEPAPEKTTEKKESAAPKKEEAPKKAPAAKKVEMKTAVVIQYAGKEIVAKEVLEAATKAFKTANKGVEIKTIEVYVKPEENVAYYVVNGEGSDDYKVEL